MNAMNNNLVIERKFRPIRVLELRSISPVPPATRLRDRLSFSPWLSLLLSLSRFVFSEAEFSECTLWLALPMSQPTNLPASVLASKPRPHNGYSDSESIYFPRDFRILGTFPVLNLKRIFHHSLFSELRKLLPGTIKTSFCKN